MSAELQTYDPAAARAALERRLTGSDELNRLVATLRLDDTRTLVNFGADAARALSDAADTALKDMRAAPPEAGGAALDALARVMTRLKLDDPDARPRGLGRLFGRESDRSPERWEALGAELDRAYVRLRAYAEGLRRDAFRLERLFAATAESYERLVRYTLAAEQACRELRAWIPAREAAGADPFERQSLAQALRILERRAVDLRASEAVALQTLPMLRLTAQNDLRLADKIEAALLVSLPAFRNALSDAVRRRRQALGSDAFAALDRRAARDIAAADWTPGQLEAARQNLLRQIDDTREQLDRQQ